MEIRAYEDPDDARPMQELQSRTWPLGMHPGGMGWSLARGEFGEATFVAVEDDHLVGWIAQPHAGYLDAQVEPGRADVALDLLDAALAEPLSDLRIAVNDADETLRESVRQRGFAPSSESTYGMWMDAGDSEATTPDGYSVRSVRPDEVDARVEVHRAAWRPADLPWHPDHRPTRDPDATSSFTADAYASCRATWLYSPDFDLVVVAPDGALAASCLAWFDPGIGVAEIEPMGVHPDHRRKGLAGSLCQEVARRVAERGGTEVFINSGPNEGYPAPPGAYTKAGFRTVRRGTFYLRPAS